MGFRKEPTHYRLSFEDYPDLEGLEVTAEALPLGDFLEINRLAVTLELAEPKEQAEQADLLFRRFSEHLISWNLEDSHGPVPATFDGVKTQELPFVQTIIGAWMAAMSSVPKPSKAASNGTGTLLEQSIPMEVRCRATGADRSTADPDRLRQVQMPAQ